MRRALRFFSVSVFQKQKKLNSLKSNNLSFCDRNLDTREGTQSSHSKNYFVFGGILSIFGVNQEKPKEEDPILTTIKNAILSIQRGDYVKADKLLHIALQQAQVARQEEAVTHVYCLMANLAMERKFYRQAEKLFTTVLSRLLNNGESEDSNTVLEISLKIAQIFQANGDLQKAEAGYNYCVNCQRNKLKLNSEVDEDTLALYGMSLDLQAQFLFSINKLREAETVWREAVGVGQQLHGVDGDQVLVVTNSLALAISAQEGREKEAAEMLEDLVTRAGKIQSSHTSSFLINLGLLKLKQGLLDKAKLNCDSAKRLATAAYDEEAAVEADECLKQVNGLLS